MLLGAHDHTLDDKNRLTLPAKFREAFSDGVVVTRGLDGCLYAFRRPDWDRLVDSRLASLDPLSPEGRRLQRHFFSGASEAELDKQGRVMIPAQLIEHAKLGKEVVVAGVNDRLEIWGHARTSTASRNAPASRRVSFAATSPSCSSSLHRTVSRPTRSCSTSASRRCRSTVLNGASRTRRTRRSTCAWIRPPTSAPP